MVHALLWPWLIAFFMVQALIGVWAARRVQTEDDFFVAGRSLGVPLLTFSLFATWFGAETCLGASGAVYADGLSGARADPFGYAACLLLMGLLLAKRLRSGQFTTLGDLYRTRFGPAAERLAVLILVPSSLIWGAAQMRAFGQVIAATTELDVSLAITVSAVLVVGYTFIGGLLGDIVTDFVQGGLLSIGLVLLALGIGRDLPPDLDLSAALDATRVSMLPVGESPWIQIDRWAVPIFGSLIAQELIARVLAARSPAVARRASVLASVLYIAIGLIPIGLGLIGPALLPDLAEPEQLLPTLARTYLGTTMFIIFSCALLSAIMSTIDSILLSSSALLSHNVINPVFNIESPARQLQVGRVIVVFAGLFAYVVALHASTIYDLVETASTFGTAGILVTTLAGLLLSRGDQRAAVAALITGLIVTPVASEVLRLPAPFLTSVACAAAVYGALALWPRSHDEGPSPAAGTQENR